MICTWEGFQQHRTLHSIHETKESYVGKRFKGNRVIQANPELSDVSHPILRAKSKLHFLWDTSFMILVNTFPTAFNFK